MKKGTQDLACLLDDCDGAQSEGGKPGQQLRVDDGKQAAEVRGRALGLPGRQGVRDWRSDALRTAGEIAEAGTQHTTDSVEGRAGRAGEWKRSGSGRPKRRQPSQQQVPARFGPLRTI